MAGRGRMADAAVLFDGQSLNVYPNPTHPSTYPRLVMATRPRLVAGSGDQFVPAIGGLSWQQLDNDPLERWNRYMRLSTVAFYVMVGGTTQVGLGQAAATIYASEGSISQTFRDLCTAIGITGYVVGTTTLPSTEFPDGADNAILVALNNLKMSQGVTDGFYDVLVDLAAQTGLSDPSSPYYADGTHPTLIGRQAMASYVGPAIDALL